MNPVVRHWFGVVLYCLALLAAIFAFIFFMRMQEEQSIVDRYRAEGVVSRAVVVDKKQDQLVREGRRGRTTRQDIYVLTVRYVPKSTVRYADFPGQVSEADLPLPPAPSGDPMTDMEYGGVIWVPKDLFQTISPGDTLVVVDTRYSGDDPEPYASIAEFDPTVFHPRIAIALAVMAVFGVLGLMVGRLGSLRQLARSAASAGGGPV
jgi:hypothetical protein